MDAYDYGLPESAIAQHPVEPRSAARLLVGPGLGRTRPGRAHATVADLPSCSTRGTCWWSTTPGCCPARLPLDKATGGGPRSCCSNRWARSARAGRPWSGRAAACPTPPSLFEPDARAGAAPVVEVGRPSGGTTTDAAGSACSTPRWWSGPGPCPCLPTSTSPWTTPSATRRSTPTPRPRDRSAAAPTAGLHFTPELLEACRRPGPTLARVDLAIGLDTFRPITAPTAEEHVIHTERYSVPAETMAACAAADRVVAVGTTAVRALESAAATGELAGRTDLYIHGRYPFRVVDVLVTNFHLPRSSLLLLVEAFCGPVWRELYATALAEGYRFLSFGDAMVVARADRRPSAARPSVTGRSAWR